MPLKIRSIVLMLICGALFSPFANADETQNSDASEKHRVAVGSRAEPFEKQIVRLKYRDSQDPGEEKKKSHDNKKEHKPKNRHGNGHENSHENSHGQAKDKEQLKAEALMLAKRLYVTTHPAAYQNLVAVSYYGDTVELIDGSIWTISSSDAYKAAHWFPNDIIVISPNQDWFSSYSFRLINQTTGESLASNLYLGPIDPVYYSLYTYWIVGIDYYYNTVYLSDGSIWDMSLFDMSVISEWLVNDIVIVGVNTGKLSSFNPNILINVNKLNYAAGAVSY